MPTQAFSPSRESPLHPVCSGTFAPVVPLPMRWGRARAWARRARVRVADAVLIARMRRLERLNLG